VTDPFAAIPPFTEAETVLPDLYEIVGRRQVGEVLQAGLDTGLRLLGYSTGPSPTFAQGCSPNLSCVPSTPPQHSHTTNLNRMRPVL
jgi:hypothetical protein